RRLFQRRGGWAHRITRADRDGRGRGERKAPARGVGRAALISGPVPLCYGRRAMTELGLAELFRAVATAVPERECLRQGARRVIYREVDARTDRLARVLGAHGLGLQRERAELAGWESGQDHVALYM